MFLEREIVPTERTVRVDACHAGHEPSPRILRGERYAAYRSYGEPLLALLLLVLAVPLLLVAALLVKLTSRGPAFYLQKRVGRNGQVYTLIKVRTMYHDCERLTGPQWAKVQDPRITLVGRWLRRMHLDELPQLWNVLRGEMSLVGPRPERPEIAEQLERFLPRYRERLALRPGLTGLAQVQLPPDCDLTSVRIKLAHDLYYVQQVSGWLDVRILLCTVCHVLGVPFTLSNRVLHLPSGEEVERVYQRRVPGQADWTMQVT